MIYLDNAASTKPRKEVVDAMVLAMEENYANADAIHDFGHKILLKIKNAKKTVGKYLGVNPEKIFFTSGGGEGNNIILQGIINANSKLKKHLITTKIEHPSVYEVFRHYEENGFRVDYLDVDKNGFIDLDSLSELICEDTVVVSIGAVNSETGTIQDLKKISEIIKEKNKNTYFHTDFVQGFGLPNINFSKIKVDALTVSGHKIYAPKGIGAIYVGENVKIDDIIFGSNSANGVIKRTLPTELILAFSKAVEILSKEDEKEAIHSQNFKINLAKKLSEEIENIKINSLLTEKSSPKILNISFNGTKGEVLTHFLGMYDIFVSTGSACSSKKGNSRILAAMGLSQSELDGAIRFSFSNENKLEEIEEIVKRVKESVARIRKMR
ncbi:cysteine desulfurase [Leptotrichia sp. oral taxon 218]|jgi:cysteine desulfurase|uniref:cysteine desulfurase family protein n=1 Tax=Leptotrichia sp. oral taxon 218 TaxID=712361 RepID=UPI001B8B975F|nr:cysteine desulfurase family protein [Leptotrichia sp. oral taxon 218]QUB95727.1 cysteine desulfurase [Leptotrichia sp. oral taxon 218]